MNTDKQTKIIIALVIIIGIMLVGLCYLVFSHQDAPKVEVKNTTANDTLVINKTTNETNQTQQESGKYGRCAICGRALTYSEATDEYTQGKVCDSCAKNPYYQSGPGAEYANRKLYEAYPEDYSWFYDDTPTTYYDDYDDGYDYSSDYDDSYYDNYDYYSDADTYSESGEYN